MIDGRGNIKVMLELLIGFAVFAVALLLWPIIDRWHQRRAWRLAHRDARRAQWLRWSKEDLQ